MNKQSGCKNRERQHRQIKTVFESRIHAGDDAGGWSQKNEERQNGQTWDSPFLRTSEKPSHADREKQTHHLKYDGQTDGPNRSEIVFERLREWKNQKPDVCVDDP